MEKIIRALTIVFIAIIAVSCKTYTGVNVRHVSNIEAGQQLEGFYYFLPRTVVNIDVTIIKTEELPGPYAQFAERFLGIDNAIRVSSANYHIAEITINSSAEPDPDEFYFVEYNPRFHARNPISLQFNESGSIISVNNRPVDIYLDQNEFRRFELGGFEQLSPFNAFLGKNVQERVDTIIEKILIDTISVEHKSLRRSLIQKPSEVRARELADYILKLRNKQFDLISGFAEITYSKEAIQYMYTKMEKQESDYVELFSGITNTTKLRYSFKMTPSIETAGIEHILFHFSENRGLDAQPFSGSQPVYATITSLNTLHHPANHHNLSEPVESQINGFFYRLPAYGMVAIKRDNTVIADTRLLITQYGQVKSLPPTNLKIEFFPDSGALKSVDGI